jgi:hypothetical protein
MGRGEQASVAEGWPLPEYLNFEQGAALLGALENRWRSQANSLSLHNAPGVPEQVEDLEADLAAMRHWFDPTATGGRLRPLLEAVPKSEGVVPDGFDTLWLRIPGRGELVTPEGRAALWCLRHAIPEDTSKPETDVWIDPGWTRTANEVLLERYRSWCQQRIRAVAKLLAGEAGTGTLRPTAAGMLLVLLINRNTAAERAIPRPPDAARANAISTAMAAPALAYAHTLAGKARASHTGLDLYRGWALGELSRRLGSGLVTTNGIYLRPEAVEEAIARLEADLQRRPLAVRARVPQALEAALEEYERSRHVLDSLGLAYERPSQTAELVQRLISASGPRELVSP